MLVVLGLLSIPASGQTSTRDTPSAEHLLKETEVTASRQHKNVLLIFSASWCGPCHLLQNFLIDPTIQPILDQHFVNLIIVHGEHPGDTRHQDTLGADDLLDSLHDTDTSLPLIVVLSSRGQLIVDSVRPVYGRRNIQANIGYPVSPNGIDWFMEMLRRAAPSLTSAESETIQRWLVQHGDH